MRRSMRNNWLTLTGWFRKRVWSLRAEVMTALAGMVGWFLITYAIAEFFRVWLVYPFSLGIFLLGCVGFGFLRMLMTEGFYVLTKSRRNRPSSPQ